MKTEEASMKPQGLTTEITEKKFFRYLQSSVNSLVISRIVSGAGSTKALGGRSQRGLLPNIHKTLSVNSVVGF
jgi:hypothetical protein